MSLEPSSNALNSQGFAQISEWAKRRRSIRKYTGEPISTEVLEKLLDTAGRAPSSWNLQPWRMVVVTQHESKQQLMKAANGQEQVGGAAAVIVLYSDMKDVLARLDDVLPDFLPPADLAKRRADIEGYFAKLSPEATEAWGRNQGYIFLGWLLLTAEAMGLGTSPMLGFSPDAVKQLYSLPANVEVPALIALGWPANEGKRSPRHLVPSISRWIK